MKYSIPRVFLFLFLFLGLVGLVLVVSVSYFFYQSNVQKTLDERTINIQTLANTIGSPFWIHQELLHIPGTVENFMHEMLKIPGVEFVRIVNTETAAVEKSADKRDVGMKVTDMPLFKDNTVLIRDGTFKGEPIKELTIKSKAGDNLWMGASLKDVQRSALLTGIFIGQGIFMLFGVAWLMVFVVSRSFLINPLLSLLRAFEHLKKEDYSVRLGGVRSVEMESVFRSFNSMVHKLGRIRERERMLSAAKSEFISTASHQLRTPLAPIRWSLKELSGEPRLAKYKDDFRKLLFGIEQVISLVNSMLNVSRIENGEITLSIEDVHLEDIVGEIVEESKSESQKKKIDVTIEKPKDPLPIISADKDRLGSTLRNLLNNAINYTLPGGEVSIILSRDTQNAYIRVKDTGVGVAEKDRAKIFNRFFRSSQAMQMQKNGLGLGLYIAKTFVTAHGGDLTLEETKEGEGSTFLVRIPLKRSKK